MRNPHHGAGAILNKAGIIAVAGAITGIASLVCGAVPAISAPAPVPTEIPVAMLVDVSSGQTLYARETERRFMPASVVKVMTAYTAFRLIHEGKLNPATPLVISQELEDEWSGEGSTMFLLAGERPTVGQLLLGATTVSGNDACVALAIAATGSVDNWLVLMNENAKELGMRNTHFGSANGYPDEGHTFTSAQDLAKLGQAITSRYPDLYRRYFGHRQLTWRKLTQANHEPLTGRVAGADGMKTGFTNEAGYTLLGSGERDGRRLVLVLAGAPTASLRDDTARKFLEWGFSDFQRYPLIGSGVVIGNAMVQEGSTNKVRLRTPAPVAASVPQGMQPQVQFQILYQGPIRAPIMQGDEIARLRVTIAGMDPYEVPLEAAESVPAANLWQRVRNGLVGLFG
ncbi:D-alanyl-D-alanine carboxypeptidase family protein [Alteraurantiacibacter aestuarii]|uniref:D-alanyl-D-alanine carboxypeptidase family protein n=1 Tax=Alteraurantiacibacter aestuarii TaxID=650004 RepID=UPI0031D692F1